jgi:alpha-ketoglutarate-dependent taurine dioxygenase
MNDGPPTPFDPRRPSAFRRKAVRALNEFPFEIASLSPDKEIPAVLRPAMKEVNLISWCAANRDVVEDLLLRRRALLFRGFGISSPEALRDFAVATSDGLLLDYRDRSSPREEISDRVYTSTDYPEDQEIFQHNEGTYWIRWPLKTYFSCLIAPERGGATPIADGRKIFAHISPATRERFIKKKVMYVRNYNDGFGLTWQTVFQTDKRKTVENYCLENQIEFEWKTGDRLRTRAVRPAVVMHPRTGEEVWFNHATFFHVSTLEPGIRDLLLSEFALEDLPYNTYYGDGSQIEPSALDELRAAYRRELVSFPWEEGDVLMLDNMSITHGRESFVGSRRVIVAMADPYESPENQGAR